MPLQYAEEAIKKEHENRAITILDQERFQIVHYLEKLGAKRSLQLSYTNTAKTFCSYSAKG